MSICIVNTKFDLFEWGLAVPTRFSYNLGGLPIHSAGVAQW